ncbi:MAG: N-acetylmuramoyl-L-alanine amidase [Clostridia bacterium]|nr:N-acetylmuramoyl-L-alanine amidase [Clostridia bacterium]
MKKSRILLIPVIIALLIACVPHSSIIYASRLLINGSFPGKSSFSRALSPSLYEEPRDFKIPDIENEHTAYSTEPGSYTPYFDDAADFKPIPWKKPKLVVIDPGHGGSESGAVVNGIAEKEINLDVSLRLHSILKSKGVLVLLTRKDDSFLSPRERIDFANRKEAALFVSIHSNWFKDSSLHGTMTLYFPSKKLSAGYLNEIDYATSVQAKLMEKLPTRDRGIIDRTDLAVLRHARMPSVLVELGFMTNKSDASLMSSSEFRQSAAEGLAAGIMECLNKIDSP